MQSIFSNALSRAVAKHIDLSVTRRETLAWLTLLIMQQGTICLWRGGGARGGGVVVALVGLAGKPWVLAIDRTNWDFGRTTINILMISVVWNGSGIPLLWMLLPTGGETAP